MLFAFRSHLNLEMRWNYFYYTRRILIQNLIFSCELDEYLCFSAENFLLMQWDSASCFVTPLLRQLFSHLSKVPQPLNCSQIAEGFMCNIRNRIQFEFNKYEKTNHEKNLFILNSLKQFAGFCNSILRKILLSRVLQLSFSLVCALLMIPEKKIT